MPIKKRMLINMQIRFDLQQRSIGQSTIVTTLLSSRSVFEFLEAKVHAFDCESGYTECAKAGLNEACDNGLTSHQYFETLEAFQAGVVSTQKEKSTVMRQKKVIEELLWKKQTKEFDWANPLVGLLGGRIQIR
ncbi:uncharacterized protein N7483_002897 [Penicillium malachiteum]|uniref:uncharacterized protein n=1 Tax=Penicillium malachiteum TaxID=1324776 RepID=UPI002548510B|nr:uncharacterized protein N7483_002897 [Penicillium malachiteum]KAJ5737772.1 hypothetical protein N7483_002897 [Penicillium malachiteum]